MPKIYPFLIGGYRHHRGKAAQARCEPQCILARQGRTKADSLVQQLCHTFHPLISDSAHQSICEPEGVLLEITS